MSLLTYNWQEPDFTGLISNALHGEEQQRLQAMQQAEQQRLAMKQASDLSLQLRQEARMAGNERFRQQLEATREGREQATSDSLIAHRKAQDDYNYGPGGDVDLSGLLSNGGGTGATGGIGSDITKRYSYDPDTGALITPISSFGHLPDVTTGQDDGLFAGGKNGASVLKADGTPITAADVSDVRAHPERYHDNPEPYAAFPAEMYKSGAVKAGEKYWVSAPDKDGNDHWAQVTARDVGPSAKNRGLDVNPTVLDALGVGTDAKVRVYVPGAENIVSGGAPAAGGTPDLSASIRNLPPAQQAAIARAAVTARVRAQANPHMEDLGNGNVRINGSVYHQNDDGTMTKVGAGGSSSGPKVKDNFTDDDGNIYTQLTDGTWQGGKVPPPGAQKVGTKRAGGGQESEAKLTVMYSRAASDEKKAQAELDAMAKTEQGKNASDRTLGYPWTTPDGKMWRQSGEEGTPVENDAGVMEPRGKTVEIKDKAEYDALVANAAKAERWAQTVKRAQQQQDEVWAKMNGEAPPQSAPSGSAPPPPKDTSEQVLQMPTSTASGSVPATPIPPSPPNIMPPARPAAQASGGIPPFGVLGPELGPSARKNMADLAATINAGVVPKSEWAVQYEYELKSQQMHGQHGGTVASASPFRSADDVKKAIVAGKLSKDAARKILRDQFGFQ